MLLLLLNEIERIKIIIIKKMITIFKYEYAIR